MCRQGIDFVSGSFKEQRGGRVDLWLKCEYNAALLDNKPYISQASGVYFGHLQNNDAGADNRKCKHYGDDLRSRCLQTLVQNLFQGFFFSRVCRCIQGAHTTDVTKVQKVTGKGQKLEEAQSVTLGVLTSDVVGGCHCQYISLAKNGRLDY